MSIEKAIKEVKELLKHKNDYDYAFGTQIYRPYAMGREDYEPIEVILTALDEKYNKGYQDGFKQAKFDCEMDKLDGR